jgi:hypothetical protein
MTTKSTRTDSLETALLTHIMETANILSTHEANAGVGGHHLAAHHEQATKEINRQLIAAMIQPPDRRV